MGSFRDFSGCRNKRWRQTRDRVRAIQLERLERRLVLSATIGATVNVGNGHITLNWIGDTSADDVTVTYDSVSPQFTFSDPGHNIYVPSEPYLSINNNDTSSVSVAPATVLFAITKINFSDGTTTGTPSGPPVSDNTYNLPTNCPGTALSVVGPASGTVTDTVTLGEANGQIGTAFPSTSITGYASPSSVDLTVDDLSDTGTQVFTISPSSLDIGSTPTALVTYGGSNIAALSVEGGNGGNTFDVTGTPVNCITTLTTGTGPDVVTLGANTVAPLGAQNLSGTININSSANTAPAPHSR